MFLCCSLTSSAGSEGRSWKFASVFGQSCFHHNRPYRSSIQKSSLAPKPSARPRQRQSETQSRRTLAKEKLAPIAISSRDSSYNAQGLESTMGELQLRLAAPYGRAGQYLSPLLFSQDGGDRGELQVLQARSQSSAVGNLQVSLHRSPQEARGNPRGIGASPSSKGENRQNTPMLRLATSDSTPTTRRQKSCMENYSSGRE